MLPAGRRTHQVVSMHIVCTTISAAAEVLVLLLSAHLQPLRDFEIRPVLSITPPITYTLYSAMTTAQVTKIRTVADTTVIG